jgi:hypothetical protein
MADAVAPRRPPPPTAKPLSEKAQECLEAYEREQGSGHLIAVPSDSLKSLPCHPAWVHLHVVHRARLITVEGKEKRRVDASSKQTGFICVHCGVILSADSSTAKRHVGSCKTLSSDHPARATYQQQLSDYEKSASTAKLKQNKLVVSSSQQSACSVISQAWRPPVVKWDRSSSAVSIAVDEAALLLIVKCYLPFSLVDENEFRLLLAACSQGYYQPFSAKQLATTFIPRVAHAVVDEVRRPRRLFELFLQ